MCKSLLQPAPTPYLAGLPGAQLCQAVALLHLWAAHPALPPPPPPGPPAPSPGPLLLISLGSCLAAEKGLWNPPLFSQPLLNSTSIFFPFPNRNIIYLGL